MVKVILRVEEPQGRAGVVWQALVTAIVPVDLLGWPRAELGRGEEHCNETCVLDVLLRAVVVEEPVAAEELEHNVRGHCRRLRDGAAQEGSAEALPEGLKDRVHVHGALAVVEFGPADYCGEGDVDGAACVGADEELDPEDEGVGVHG